MTHEEFGLEELDEVFRFADQYAKRGWPFEMALKIAGDTYAVPAEIIDELIEFKRNRPAAQAGTQDPAGES